MNGMVLMMAAVKLASPFTDGAVLQRDRPVPVWGWADPGEKVEVAFGGQTANATADGNGRWRVDLRPMPASCEGRTLTANGISVRDVLVGEVWICSGQSNMEFPVNGWHPHLSDRLGATIAQMTRLPNVRFARSPYAGAWSAVPKERAATPVVWKRFTRENLAGSMAFSAVGAYFALEIYHALDSKVPVAVVGAYEGGTPINAWTPQAGETRNATSCVAPGVLFNELVGPWCPYAIRGLLWYQGCYDAPHAELYTAKMHRLYDGWAAKFGQPDLPLLFAQLAPWWSPDVPRIQEAQARFAAEQPNAAMAVINDVGNFHDIHPHEKSTVAKRLALHALKRFYGFTDIEADSPTLRSWKVENGAFHLAFDHAKSLHLYNADFSVSNGFEIAGADGRFVPATIDNLVVSTNFWKKPEYRGLLKGEGLIVRADGVPAPCRLRYLHSAPWRGNIYNEVNLPLGAFHIDADVCTVEVGKDGVATVEAALGRVRELRAKGAPYAGRRAVIRLPPGTHRLAETLALGPEDSNLSVVGTEGKTVLSGGEELRGFVADAKGVWHLKTDLRFEQLWIDGRLATRARSPNEGYFYIREPVYEGPDPDRPGNLLDLSHRAFGAFPEDVKDLAALPADELREAVGVAYYGWDTDWMHFRHVDPETGVVMLRQSHARDFFMWPKYMCRYTVENYRTALDAPGEWFLDRKAGELLYVPRAGERPETSVVTVPRLNRILDVKADGKGRRVTNLSFEGVSFEYAGWTVPTSLFTRQAAYNVDAACELSGAHGFTFLRCRWAHVAPHGVWARDDCRDGGFRTCLFEDIGGGAVWIGSRKKPADADALTRRIAVEDCIITRAGMLFPEGTGVAVAFASDCTIAHNELADIGYTGVSFGYSWNYTPAPNRNTLVLDNHIHHLGRATESDMAGVYSLGDNYGSRVAGNYIHDVVSYDYTGFGGEGIYGDEGTSGILWESNVVLRTKGGSINMNFGKANVFRGNVLALPGVNGLEKEPFFKHWQVEPHVTAVVSNNVCYAADPAEAKLLRRGYDKEVGTNVVHGGNTVWDAKGFATNAYAQAIVRNAGVRGDSAWKQLAAALADVPDPKPPVVPPRYEGMRKCATGFEAVGVGGSIPSVFECWGGCGGQVKVTDRVVRHGRRAVEVTDRKGLKPAFQPLILSRIRPYVTNGTCRVRFSLRLDGRSRVMIESRDLFPTAMSRSSYVEGCQIHFGEGRVVAGGKPVMELKPDVWCDCELVFRFAPGRRPSVDLRLTDESGRTVEKKDLPLANPAFGKLSWIGFFTLSDEDSKWWLDDFSIEREIPAHQPN